MNNQPIIHLEGIQIFQSGKSVLADVELKINPGEFVYVIGKTGSGKSSLLKLIYADIPVKEGLATALGYNLKKIKTSETPFLRRKLGIVFQDFQLLDDRTIEANLSFVLKATGWKDKNKINQRVLEVLEEVGLISP